MRTEGTGGEGYIGDDFYRGGNQRRTFMEDGEALVSIGGVVVEVTGSKVFPKKASGGGWREGRTQRETVNRRIG